MLLRLLSATVSIKIIAAVWVGGVFLSLLGEQVLGRSPAAICHFSNMTQHHGAMQVIEPSSPLRDFR